MKGWRPRGSWPNSPSLGRGRSPARARQSQPLPLPEQLVFRCLTPDGQALTPTVRKGQTLMAGDVLAQDAKTAARLYAPVTGSVLDVVWQMTPGQGYHASIHYRPTHGRTAPAGSETAQPVAEPSAGPAGSPQQRLAQAAAVCGLDLGAIIRAPFVVVNGCEPDLGIATRTAWLNERTADVAAGVAAIAACRGERPMFLVTYDGQLSDGVRQALVHDMSPVPLQRIPLHVPWGQDALLARYVQRVKHWQDSPLVVGVERVAALAGVLQRNMPVPSVLVTVDGDAVDHPGIYRVPVGSRLSELLHFAGLRSDRLRQVLRGGFLAGEALADLEQPVSWTDLAFLALTRERVTESFAGAGICLRCGRCIHACPVHLVPHQIARWARGGHWQEAQAAGVEQCVLCGLCAYACPARLPLVALLRLAQRRLAPSRSVPQAMTSAAAGDREAKAAASAR